MESIKSYNWIQQLNKDDIVILESIGCTNGKHQVIQLDRFYKLKSAVIQSCKWTGGSSKITPKVLDKVML
jgi:hypothetical protein